MLIVQNGYECDYELWLFADMFFEKNEEVYIYSNFLYENSVINVYTEIVFDGRAYFYDYYFDYVNKGDKRLNKKVFTAACTKSFCHCAKQVRDVNIPWGVMCGIRPAKNVRELWESGMSREEAYKNIREIYEVTEDKIDLAYKVAENEEELLKQIGKNSVSVYIGIPFCPSRCLYCSFVSTDIRVSGKYMDEFVEKLLLEIDKTADIIEKMGVYVENVYIGGGTPTTLSAKQLESVLRRITKYFDLSKIKEFTLEAGRVDTITAEKLETAKRNGVNRISVNPQSMNDKVLKGVRRTHNSKMVEECFKMAKSIGFDVINMDLIAGLPGESVEMFKSSLDRVIELKPENITVHSMCIKRAAGLRLSSARLTEAKNMNEMLSYTQKRMKETGMEPYYMYRQKNILGNLENVGYSKKGCMSTYNINIMEEKQTIIALGGGGSTKIVMDDRIERIFNFKDPYEYIRRFDEILSKKDEILKILESSSAGKE